MSSWFSVHRSKRQQEERLGIYISPNEDGSSEYFINGRIMSGTRAVKGDDIDYQTSWLKDWEPSTKKGKKKGKEKL